MPGQTETASAPSQPASTPASASAAGESTTTLTQAEVDRIVEQRLTREREATAKRLKLAGFNSLDELEEATKKRTEAERATEAKRHEELAQNGRFQELYEAEKKRREELESSLRTELSDIKGRYEQTLASSRRERAVRELVAAASHAGAVAPEQIAALLANRVTLNEQGGIEVLDEHGKPATDGKGNALSLQSLVQGFVGQNPHFQRAAAGVGAHGSASTLGVSAGVDVKSILASNDPTLIRKHERDIIAAFSKGA